METIREAMRMIIKKCDICMNGNIISRELLLSTFYDFIMSTMEKGKHNVGIVLHTGSVCFDAIILTCAALSDILYNGANPDDIVYSLMPGDVVLYYKNKKPRRCVFKGFVNNPDDIPTTEIGNYILLEQEKKGRTYLAKNRWAEIEPYWGNSTSMDGRGLRKENGKRYDFLKHVLEMNDMDIPRVVDTSTVVVMPREKANVLVNGLSFRFNNEEIKLLDLVTASYFTDGNHEYQYGGNPAKTEPVLKVTGKVSVARKLLLQRNGNHNIGLIILGNDSYRKGESEIPELMERKSIQYVYLCTHIDSEVSSMLVDTYENAEVFACTKDFLLSNSLPATIANPLTEQLERQVDVIIDREVNTIPVENFIEPDEYKDFKKSMYSIKTSDYDTDEKDDFLIQAYSMMNLFLTAVFPIESLEKYIDTRKIENVERPDRRIQYLNECIKTFPYVLKDASNKVLSILENAYCNLYDLSYKEKELMNIIEEHRGLTMAIIIPKAYYSVLLEDKISSEFPELATDVTVVTANRFNNMELYDLIIVVGDVDGTRFDALRCRSAQKIEVLLYDVEQYHFKKKVRKAKKAEHIINQRSTITTDDEYEEEVLDVKEASEDEIDNVDFEIDDFIGSVAAKTIRNTAGYTGNRTMADIMAVAKFTNEEVAFFTPNYKAYLLDDAESSVNEVSVKDLAEGDTIIFTRSNSETRDIVENILEDMVYTKSASAEVEKAYYMAREWKTTLIDYMNETGKDEQAIAEEMIQNGVGVQEVTIKGWLDEESHTVRPKKLDSIKQIAMITRSDSLYNQAEECFEAGGIIYKVRRRILKAIGQAIMGEVTGEVDAFDPIISAVSERIRNAAVILQIETLVFANDKVPINMINRPVNMG